MLSVCELLTIEDYLCQPPNDNKLNHRPTQLLFFHPPNQDRLRQKPTILNWLDSNFISYPLLFRQYYRNSRDFVNLILLVHKKEVKEIVKIAKI